MNPVMTPPVIKDEQQGSNQAAGKSAEREKLPMENKFDGWVYGWLNYVGQAATGIALTRYLRNGSGQETFHAIQEWFGRNVVSNISKKTGVAAFEEAAPWTITSIQVMVGNAFLLPVKFIENYKPDIVREWTEQDNAKREKRGEVVSSQEKKHQKELLGQLEQEPKQTWKSLIGGRLFGLAAVYATIPMIGKKRSHAVEDALSNGSKTLFNTAGLTGMANSNFFDQHLRLAAYDGFYSAIAAGGLYVYSHYINPPNQHDKAAEPKNLSDELPHSLEQMPSKSWQDKVEPNRLQPLAKAAHKGFSERVLSPESTASLGMAV